ncbi:ABC transporter substrate-binding protein [Caballeronia grimmiae]|uniref:ABC transporter substrate-binding protein n=1 Tax=Caballeronia grimmiae TaxID=1071679 RepID=A0A069PCW7_9BURK|nr:ABC transporter substrate-binding protein [Caballeronia grimmiae]KDR35126.1 ABC transporter substrate-binding protein [Caballeronia grimmiae]GGD89298.1 peptide ABC transporter substrate-binding protein [Caballeronia grimmiae]
MTNGARRRFLGWLLAVALIGAETVAVAAAPVSGGTLTWIVTPEPSSIVPLTTTAGGNAEIGPKVVEGLLTYDKDLNPKPLLATAWSVSKDGLHYRFTLRQGVKWHDGKPFTSDDVAFSILTLKQVHPRGRSTFANVTGVETPDAYTAIIDLSKPAPFLLTALSGSESPIIPKHLYEGTDIVSNPHNSAPIGTGPFVFKKFVRGDHILFERNPDYWDKPKPYVDRVIVRFIPDAAARAAALETGAANLGDQAIPLSDVKRFSSLPNFHVDTTNWPYVSNHQQLIFNLDTPVLKDKAVRRAISQAIDVNALNRVVWYGYGTVSAAAIGVANTRYHNANIHYFPYDPGQANAALDQLGLKRGPDGKRFTLRVLYNPFQDPRAADYVRQSLARIGIDAQIQSYDFGTYVVKAYTDRAFDITFEALANVFDPTVGVQRVFWSKNFKIGLPFSNAAHYFNPEVDRLLEAASVETDEGKRRQLFLQFQQIVHDDIPSIEFGANPNITIVSNKVRNYAPTGEGLRGNFADLYIEK